MNEVNETQLTDNAHGRTFGAPIMEMKNITMRFGGVIAIQDISFDILEGEIRASGDVVHDSGGAIDGVLDERC